MVRKSGVVIIMKNKLANIKEIYSSYPLVSIMIPTYNRPELFEKTLQSALAQSYDNIEILVNDNSTNEDTSSLIRKYECDSRLKYYRNKDAKCKEDNFRPFEHNAKGEYLQWCMDDDILHKDKLSMMVSVMVSNPHITLTSSQRGFIDENDSFIAPRRETIIKDDVIGRGYKGNAIGNYMLKEISNLIGEPSAALFRRSDLEHHYWQADCRGYKTISDVVMWLELLEKGDLFLFKEPLSYYRCHSQQEGQQPEVVLLSRVEWLKLLQEYYERNIFISRDDYIYGLCKLKEDYLSIKYDHRCIAAANYSAYCECMELIQEIISSVNK